jgi:uncharacterized protein
MSVQLAQPAFRVLVDGKDISPVMAPRLIQLDIQEKRAEEADEVTIVLDDSRGDLAIPAGGAKLDVSIGWKRPGQSADLFSKGSFKVDTVEHDGSPDRLTIKGSSADFTGDMRVRRDRSWTDTTLGAVVSQVAKAHGLDPRCAAELAAVQVKILAQSGESDLAMLRRIGREHDAVATVKAGKLILKRIGDGKTSTGAAIADVTVRRAEGDGHRWSRQKREEYTGVTASWHDQDGAAKKTVTVGQAAGARKLSRVYASEASARRAATAARSRQKRQPATLDVYIAEGRADLYPERRARVSGFKAEIDATTWLIVQATHSVSKGGFTTQLQMESAA